VLCVKHDDFALDTSSLRSANSYGQWYTTWPLLWCSCYCANCCNPVATWQSFGSKWLVGYCHQEWNYMLLAQQHFCHWNLLLVPFYDWYLAPVPFNHALYAFPHCWHPWCLNFTIHCWALPVYHPIYSWCNKCSKPSPNWHSMWIAWNPLHLTGMFLSTSYGFVGLSHLRWMLFICITMVESYLDWYDQCTWSSPNIMVFVCVGRRW